MWSIWTYLRAIIGSAALLAAGAPVFAEGQQANTGDGRAAVIAPDPGSTVGIISGEAGSTSLRAISELSVIAAENDLRIVPIAGRGPLQNIADLMHLKGADGAIVQADVLDQVARAGTIEDIAGRLSYVTRLYNAELHLIARDDEPGLLALKGRRINTGVVGSGAQITANAVLRAAGLDFVETSFDTAHALHLLKTGRIDAVVYIDGAPVPVLERMDPADGLKLIEVPMTIGMPRHYQPAWLQNGHYAGLIDPGQSVETVSVGMVLMAYDWPKGSKGHVRIGRLYDTLGGNMDRLAGVPNHPVWRGVALSARLAGWQRHRAALGSLAKTQADGLGQLSDKARKLRAMFKSQLLSSSVDVAATNRPQPAATTITE